MGSKTTNSGKLARVAAAALMLVALGATAAEARPGGGGSFGSRGGRTFSAPPITSTAPRTAAPIERSITQPSSPSPSFGQPAARPGFFNRPGFGTGLLGGLLGAGLFGMLFGHGFFGGIGGLFSLIGMLVQFALIAGLVMLALRFFRSRQQPAFAGAYPRTATGLGGMGGSGLGSGMGGPIGGGSSRPTAPNPSSGQPVDSIGIGPADYETFEKRLVEINAAYDREDLTALRSLATPEMVSYFGEELAGHASRGLHDRVSAVKLEQGDLAESWREGATDYATVAMRFSLVNALTERTTGRVVEGDAARPQEVREVWTFRRDRGGDWMLSAIQQA